MRATRVVAIAAVLLLAGVLSIAAVGTALATGPGPVPMMGYGQGGWGPAGGMMGGYGAGTDCPGHGGGGWPGYPGASTPISDEQAIEIAQDYIAEYNNPDLELVEIMAFDNHFYAQVRERSTGINAFEFLIDRYTGAAYPEPGPNMMWNTKYGHMAGWGGMMGGWWGQPSGEMRISPEEARQIAQDYLDATGSGLEVSNEVDAFYGYYTIHTLRDGQIVGMLSVNGYSGQVWVHTWHGEFLGMVYEAEGAEGEGH